MKKILVTGTAGFIGFHLTTRLLRDGYEVVGLDCVNDYYDIGLKFARLGVLGLDREAAAGGGMTGSSIHSGLRFVRLQLADKEKIDGLFSTEKFDACVHLAAQAGVRYSLVNPQAYIDSNITGHLNILEACRHHPVEHLVYASSSSVYGMNKKMPLSVSDNVDHPISLYAATKKTDELMSHVYSHLFGVPVTGLRFFTVYGPWGRPDMALFLFTKAILEGREIDVFNHGKMKRDFTYIDDIIEGVVRVMTKIPSGEHAWTGKKPDPASSFAPYRIFNIGNNQPVELMDFIAVLEDKLGKKARMRLLPLQLGDVPETYADVNDLIDEVGFKPGTSIREGIGKFVEWYREYYKK